MCSIISTVVRRLSELYLDVVNGSENEGSVPYRLIKTDRRKAESGDTMGDVCSIDGDGAEQATGTLDYLARGGARRMTATALEAEVEN